MRNSVLALYMLALILQIGGVYFVIHDAIKSRANVRTFAEEFGNLTGPHNPNNWPHFIEPVIAKWITSENALSDLRRFAPIVVVLLGIAFGFVGNMLSLYIPAAPANVAPVAPATSPPLVTPTR